MNHSTNIICNIAFILRKFSNTASKSKKFPISNTCNSKNTEDGQMVLLHSACPKCCLCMNFKIPSFYPM